VTSLWFTGTTEHFGRTSLEKQIGTSDFVRGLSRSGHLQFTYTRENLILFPLVTVPKVVFTSAM